MLQWKSISMLVILGLTLSSIPIFLSFSTIEKTQVSEIDRTSINLQALAKNFGEHIPVTVRFENGLTDAVYGLIQSLGIKFSLGSARNSHIGSYYLLEGNADGLTTLIDFGAVAEIAPQTFSNFLESPRDISIPEINADDVWNTLDDFGRNITGQGIMIADLDSGVDWRHPDLWYADGGTYPYINSTSTGFVNGTDAVDLNRDFALTPDEILYALDLNRDGVFQPLTEWLWADNVTQNAFPDLGEPFFVVNDTLGNAILDGDDSLVMLGTPKTKYIVEMDGDPVVPHQLVWDRDVNLTSSTHSDTSIYGGGHGTAVASILLGGQLGYRKWVGVAPDSELMMIRVIGDDYTTLSIEAGLAYANATGADVVIIEIGSWTYDYLDGSSLVEQMIDDLVADGIPVIAPSGNLGGKDKHCMFNTVSNTPYLVDWMLPPAGGEVTSDINDVFITILSIDSTDFQLCNFSLVMDRSSFFNYTLTIYLHPGIGYGNFHAETGATNFVVESFISQSTRGTSMLGIWIHGILPTITAPPWHKLNVTTSSPTEMHGYISDEESSWSGGCTWTSDVSDAYEITWPSTADSAISVASYNTRYGIVGDLATYSSRGPRIDGIIKQSVGAPGGFDIISAYSNGTQWQTWYNNYGSLPFDQQFGSYRLFSGTSAAGPHVAGCAALVLQADPTVGDQVKTIIESTARTDGNTSTVPNSRWGFGKLDADAALSMVLADTNPPVFDTHSRIPLTPNATESVTIIVNVTDVSGVAAVVLSYYNGTSWINVTMSWDGSNYVGVIPAFPLGTEIEYKMYANDTLGNWAVTPTFSYTVGMVTTPTTSTTPTTTATTGATAWEPDYLVLALMLCGVLVLIVLYVAISRRRLK
jgi:subtilisin family serine protease